MVLETMNEFFNNRAETYDQHRREKAASFPGMYEVISTIIKPTTRQIFILDLGCGTGLELKYIFQAAPNAVIEAVDISEKMLMQLKHKFMAQNRQIIFKCASYLDILYPLNHYDLIISIMSLHHLVIDERVWLYQKIYNALKPDCLFIEGDYYVSKKTMKENMRKFKQITKSKNYSNTSYYHIDIPVEFDSQQKYLTQTGFIDQEIYYRQDLDILSSVRKPAIYH